MKHVFGIFLLLMGLAITGTSVSAQGDAKEKVARETMSLVGQGSQAYLKHDYKKAIQFYAKALELEKKEPTLDRTIRCVLIDNLAISYGITGDNRKTLETTAYGLSKDNTYPMFHYISACAHAEMNDLDNAITSLKLAFKYKENVLQGESMPDPATDDSFTRFLKNEKFQQALKDIHSGAN